MITCRCSISRFILKGIIFQYTQLQRMDLDTDAWARLRYPLNLLKFSLCSWGCRVEACIFMHIFPIVSCNQIYVYSPLQEQINTCYSFFSIQILPIALSSTLLWDRNGWYTASSSGQWVLIFQPDNSQPCCFSLFSTEG